MFSEITWNVLVYVLSLQLVALIKGAFSGGSRYSLVVASASVHLATRYVS
jgi:hypothetical protein